MKRALYGWVLGLIVEQDPIGIVAPRVRENLVNHMAMRLRVTQPLNFSTFTSAADDLLGRMDRDPEFALDVIDYLLGHLPRATEGEGNPYALAAELNAALAGGSAWEVAEVGRGTYSLQRRAVGPVREVIAELPPSSRARQHLTTAWNRLVGRSPDASTAYREAIRAVEAVAKPVVLPTNDRATLGTMIAAMRDKPEKWATTLGTVEDVRRTMELVWTSQLDRHGTDDESVPLHVTQDQADAAVHLCIALVRLFAGGHVRRVS
jgi:hypothetical protein